MENKTACLISCSDHYKHRIYVIDEQLRAIGYDTTYITSDFDHTSKQVFECPVPGCVQIHTRPYRKNLSVERILSHRMFARNVFRYLEGLEQQPDVIVALLPPNFLGHYLAKYKRRHPQVKLIFDIFDLWPETFPSGKLKKLLAPAFKVWAWIRDHSLPTADFITTECELFRNRLGLSDERSQTIYLCAQPLTFPEVKPQLRSDAIDLCYLGAINNIISIPDICGLIKELVESKPVTLHIVGKGEREQEFIDSAKAAGAEVIFYGPIYDDAKKHEIMSRCHFGLNIMKSSVCVGLTMKSVDYFRHGLPIINNIPADTQELIGKYFAGIQMEVGCAMKVVSLTMEECLSMRQNVIKLYEEVFAKKAIVEQYEQLTEKIL